MADLFLAAFLGHLIGDYLLQSTWMALKKSEKTWMGTLACTTHVLLYTVAVSLMLGCARPAVWLAIAIPHWIIDHWSLGEHWLRLIRGRTIAKTLATKGVEREFAVAFYAPVYIAVDNTIHLLFLWFTIKLMLV